MRSYLALAAYLLVAVALLVTRLREREHAADMGLGWEAVETREWLALGGMLCGLGLSVFGSCWRGAGEPREKILGALRPVLVALVAIQLGCFAWMAPAPIKGWRPPREPAELAAFRFGALALTLVPISYAWPGWPWPRARLTAFVLGYLALAIWFIGGPQSPACMDTYTMQQEACRELLQGRNPYTAYYSNIFQGADLYAPETVQDGKLRSFHYPPLSLLLAVPGYLLGDVRWSLLAAMVGAAMLLLAAARRLGVSPGSPAELAILASLCYPHTMNVVDQAWTEPFVVLLAAAALWALAAEKQRGAGLAVALVATAKQYAVLLLVPWWLSGRLSWRSLAWGLAAAGLVILPFFLADPAAFWFGTVRVHLMSNLRTDCLSVPALVGLSSGYRLPPGLSFVAAAVVTALLVWRAPRTLTSATLGGAAVLLAFIVLNKGGHLNYYWLAAMLLLMSVLTAIAEAPAKPEETSIVPPG